MDKKVENINLLHFSNMCQVLTCVLSSVWTLICDLTLKEEQAQIANDCRSNPKKFWNYSKTKLCSSIGDLIHINNNGVE